MSRPRFTSKRQAASMCWTAWSKVTSTAIRYGIHTTPSRPERRRPHRYSCQSCFQKVVITVTCPAGSTYSTVCVVDLLVCDDTEWVDLRLSVMRSWAPALISSGPGDPFTVAERLCSRDVSRSEPTSMRSTHSRVNSSVHFESRLLCV